MNPRSVATIDFIDSQAARVGARTAETLVQRQLEAHKVLLERADGSTRLAVALIGGIILVTGTMLDIGILKGLASILVLSSVLAALTAIYVSLRVSVGTLDRRVLELGPDLATVQRLIAEEGQTVAESHLSLMNMYQLSFMKNQALIDQRSRFLVLASYLLAGSATLFLAGLIYIAGVVVLA